MIDLTSIAVTNIASMRTDIPELPEGRLFSAAVHISDRFRILNEFDGVYLVLASEQDNINAARKVFNVLSSNGRFQCLP